MAETLAHMLGGFGLFLFGVWQLSESLKSLTSWRLRALAANWLPNRFAAFGWGFLAGAVAQSMSGITFIVVGMQRAKLVPSRQAYAIILGANFGAHLLVVVVTLDVNLVALYTIGVSSVLIISQRVFRFRSTALAVFGAALLFVGLMLIRESGELLVFQPWFETLIAWTSRSLWFSFAVAAILTLVVQSAAVVVVFGISMASVGALTIDETMMFIYGCGLGSGLIVLLLSVNLSGKSRRLPIYQALICFIEGGVPLALLFIELNLGIPMVKAFLLSIDVDLSMQMAILFLLLNLPAAPLFLIIGRIDRSFERLWPATKEEEMSQPLYINDHSFGDVATALSLVDLEQKRVISRFSQYLDVVRQDGGIQYLMASTRELNSHVDVFLRNLSAHQSDFDTEQMISIQGRQKLITWLEEQFSELCIGLNSLDDTSDLRNFKHSFVEGIDAVMLVINDDTMAGDVDSPYFSTELTSDRSGLMREIRATYLEGDFKPSKENRVRIMNITDAAERIFFLLSKLTDGIEGSKRPKVSMSAP